MYIFFKEETDETMLNSYLKFILVVYENVDEFFYSSDLKVLVSIFLREL